jgi:cyclopropane fatty-acyl-phospholipid synthase-like methyltransferase
MHPSGKDPMNDPRKLVKDGYNRCAQNYLKGRDPFKNRKYLELLSEKLPQRAHILDIGCGAGVPIDRYLIQKGFRVTGVDISEEQIRLAKQNNPAGIYRVQDMAEIDFPSGSFEAIVSFYAIFHIPREKHPALFSMMNAQLKPTGMILVTMGASDWEGTEEDFYGVKMFWSHYGSEKNLEIVKSSGFEIEFNEVDTSGGENHLIILAQKH